MKHLARHASFALALSTALVVSATAHAQSPGLPAEQHAGTVAFLSGGIGDDEAHRLQAAFDRYPLVVELFEQVGQRHDYTADAQVRITDAHGKQVFDAHSSGPFMLLRLAAGDYRVATELHGHSLPARSVHVSDGGHAKLTFVFPEQAG